MHTNVFKVITYSTQWIPAFSNILMNTQHLKACALSLQQSLSTTLELESYEGKQFGKGTEPGQQLMQKLMTGWCAENKWMLSVHFYINPSKTQKSEQKMWKKACKKWRIGVLSDAVSKIRHGHCNHEHTAAMVNLHKTHPRLYPSTFHHEWGRVSWGIRPPWGGSSWLSAELVPFTSAV